jgi:peptidoglycan/xylan/chitin deacetylase (PgdA/CDA1 family)
MERREVRKELIQRIGKTNSALLKGFITLFFADKFFEAFYDYNINSNKISKTITISFDCDSAKDVKALPLLLETLSSFEVKASFACVGKLIEKYPKEHQLIIENKNELINHTYTHPFSEALGSHKRFDRLTMEEQKEEVIRCHRVCKTTLNYEPVGFRIPHFGIQYTDTIYSILSEIGYSYSSSILAVKSPTYGVPYTVNEIVEFPLITCPRHPYQAFDTHHAFRSKITAHKEEKFYEVFTKLIEFGIKRRMFINMYFDPQDVMHLNDFERCLEYLKDRVDVETYNNISSTLKKV